MVCKWRRAAELQLDQRQRYLHTVESELNDVTSKHAAEKMELMRVRGEMRERLLGQVLRYARNHSIGKYQSCMV